MEYNSYFQDTQDVLALSSGWSTSNCSCWMDGSTLTSSKQGATATLQVGGGAPEACDLGETYAFIGDRAAGRGSARFYLDGKLVSTVSENAATTNRVVIFQQRWKHGITGSHTIKIVVASGRFDLDGLQVQSGWDYDSCGG